jgi:ferredoxin
MFGVEAKNVEEVVSKQQGSIRIFHLAIKQLQLLTGLQSLSKAIEVQISQKVSDFVGTVHFNVPHHSYTFDMQMPEGQTLMELSKTDLGHELLSEYLECACGGNMSCATCHVILDQKSYDSMEKPGQAEKDMLDLAYEPTDTSRLGCQLKMTPERDGMTITIPSGINNFWS